MKNIFVIAAVVLLLGAGCTLKQDTSTSVDSDKPATEEKKVVTPTPKDETKADDEAAKDEDANKDEAESETDEATLQKRVKLNDIDVAVNTKSIVVLLVDTEEGAGSHEAYMKFGCTDFLFPQTVEFSVDKSQSDLAVAIVELLTTKTDKYQEKFGLINAVYNHGLTLDNIHYDGQTRVIHLAGELKAADACTGAQIKAQLEETIKLYSDNYRILLNDSEEAWVKAFTS